MAMLKRKTSGDFVVQLLPHEVTEKQDELVQMHLELVRKQDHVAGIADTLKGVKKEVESFQDRMSGVAQVCHDKAERRYITNAEVLIDTNTWVETTYHPKDGRVLAERLVPEEERKEYRQTELFHTEVEAEKTEPAPRKARRPPRLEVVAPAEQAVAGGGGVLFSADTEAQAEERAPPETVIKGTPANDG